MKLSEITTDKTKFDVNRRDLISDVEQEIGEFTLYDGKLPKRKLIQYIILMYDPESPMRREVGHYMQRKAACAELVDFSRPKGKWAPDVDDLLVGKSKSGNKLIAAYIAYLAIPEYAELITLLEIQRVKTIETFMGNVNDNTHKVMSAVTEKIREITSKLFGSGEVEEIQSARRALYEQSNIDKPPRPEDVVDELADGKLPADFNPYGEDYVVEDPHFLDDEEPAH